MNVAATDEQVGERWGEEIILGERRGYGHRNQNDVIEDYISSFTDMISPCVLPWFFLEEENDVAGIKACTPCISTADEFLKWAKLIVYKICCVQDGKLSNTRGYI